MCMKEVLWTTIEIVRLISRNYSVQQEISINIYLALLEVTYSIVSQEFLYIASLNHKFNVLAHKEVYLSNKYYYIL